MEHAAALAAAAADTADPDIQVKIEAELNAALADVETGSIDLDELVASLAAIAGYAIDEAARLRVETADAPPAPRARDAERESVLRASVTALPPIPTRLLEEPEPHLPPPARPTHPERRSEDERRVSERRYHPDDSPPARVNRWLYGERRGGTDQRSGIERRAVPPSDGEG